MIYIPFCPLLAPPPFCLAPLALGVLVPYCSLCLDTWHDEPPPRLASSIFLEILLCILSYTHFKLNVHDFKKMFLKIFTGIILKLYVKSEIIEMLMMLRCVTSMEGGPTMQAYFYQEMCLCFSAYCLHTLLLLLVPKYLFLVSIIIEICGLPSSSTCLLFVHRYTIDFVR